MYVNHMLDNQIWSVSIQSSKNTISECVSHEQRGYNNIHGSFMAQRDLFLVNLVLICKSV